MKKNSILWCLLGLLMLALPACKDDDAAPDLAEERKKLLEQQDKDILAYLQANNITTAKRDDKGIYREIVQANPTGDLLLEGDVALIQYTIKLLDGTVVGTSVGSKPARVTYATNRSYFPFALRDALIDRKEGEVVRLYVPSPYAYSAYSDDQIKANSVLILEIEVLDIYHSLEEIYTAEQTDIQEWLIAENKVAQELPNGLHKIVLKEGTGAIPGAGKTVKVFYKGSYLSGQVFDENLTVGFSFKLNNDQVVKGFEQAIKSMKVGEKSLFIMPSALAYGNSGGFVLPFSKYKDFKSKGFLPNIDREIPPFSTLIFEIELVSVQ